MIDLGTINIRSEISVREARNKIRALATAMTYQDVEATRLATATSEIARLCLQDARHLASNFDMRATTAGYLSAMSVDSAGSAVRSNNMYFPAFLTSESRSEARGRPDTDPTSLYWLSERATWS